MIKLSQKWYNYHNPEMIQLSQSGNDESVSWTRYDILSQNGVDEIVTTGYDKITTNRKWWNDDNLMNSYILYIVHRYSNFHWVVFIQKYSRGFFLWSVMYY